jgi:chromosome segregation ATPase
LEASIAAGEQQPPEDTNLSCRLERLENKHSAVAEVLRDRWSVMQNRLGCEAELEPKVEVLQEEVATLRSQLASSESAMEQASARASKAAGSVAALLASQKSLEAKVQALDARV